MVDLFSTPSLVTIILGAVSLFIPVIDALNKEKGSKNNKIYSAISFGALAISLIIVICTNNFRRDSSSYVIY